VFGSIGHSRNCESSNEWNAFDVSTKLSIQGYYEILALVTGIAS
jgi:hypothetical protein